MHRHPSFKSTTGFTLIELLVVISIIALLIAILLPVLTKAREAAKLTQCMINQRQIATAAISYAADTDGKLPPSIGVSTGGAYSWPTYINYQIGGGANSKIRNSFGPYISEGKTFLCPLSPADARGLTIFNQEYENPTQDAMSSYFLLWNYRMNRTGTTEQFIGASLIEDVQADELLTSDSWTWRPQSSDYNVAHPVPGAVPAVDMAWNLNREALWRVQGIRGDIVPNIPINSGRRDGSVVRYDSSDLMDHTVPGGSTAYYIPVVE